MGNVTDQNELDLAELNEEGFHQWLQNKYPGRTVRIDGDKIVVSIPVKFYRRNGRQMVKTKSTDGGGFHETRSGINKELATAIAKSYQWQEQLESGEYTTLEELASANGVDRTYVGRLLKLTSLSPDLVEKILDGNEPPGVSLRQLRIGIPPLWSEQRQLWGN